MVKISFGQMVKMLKKNVDSKMEVDFKLDFKMQISNVDFKCRFQNGQKMQIPNGKT